MAGPKRSTPDDFWRHVDKGRPDQCWPWKIARDEFGYGRVRYQRVEWHAHRLAWALTHSDPGEQWVLHDCDNPPCCNPAHLFLGDCKANMQDMVKKGRHPRNRTGYLPTGDRHHGRRTPEVMARGEGNGSAVLTEEKVRQIRRERKAGATLRSLANKFGVVKGTIMFIVQRKTWAHVT